MVRFMKIFPEDFRSRLLPITLGQVFGMSCGVIGVRLSSHWVAPADYGKYGLFLTATPLGMWVVHAGLIKFTQRHWGESRARAALFHELLPAFVRQLPWLALATAATAWAIGRTDWLVVFPLLFFAATLLSGAVLGQAALQSAREHWSDFGVTGTAALTRTFLPPLLYAATTGTALALYCGVGLHALLVAGAAALALRPYWSRPPATAPQLTAVYSGPLFVVLAVSAWIMSGLNRWIVALFFGADTAGYFVLAGNMAMIAAALPGSICLQYFQPGFFAAPVATPDDRRDLARRVDRVALGYCAMALAGLAALQWIAPWFVGSLIQENYRPAIPYIMPAGFFLAALLTGSFFHSMLLAGQREQACGPADLSLAGVLALGCMVSAAAGEIWFQRWLLLAPVLPWLIHRPLARHYFFQPA